MRSTTDQMNEEQEAERSVTVLGDAVPEGLCAPVDGEYRHLVFTPEDLASLDTFQQLLQRSGAPAERAATLVVVDTGVNAQHPDLIGLVDPEVINCTDEPAGDHHGHGTMVALVALGADAMDDALRREHRIIDVKVIERDGRTRPETVVDGLERVAALARERHGEQFMVNLSLGRLRRRLLHKAGCDGTCELCDAAYRLARLPNVMVYAAAGNAGVTECPAAAAFRPGSTVIAVSANLPTAAPGTVASEGHRVIGPADEDGRRLVAFDEADAPVAVGLEQALAAMAEGDVARAMPGLIEARALEDRVLAPQAAMQLGQIAARREQPELQRREYEFAFEHGLADIRAWAGHELGVLDLRAGDRVSALAHLRAAASSGQPIATLANRNVAAMLLEDGDMAGAVEALTRAAADDASPYAEECRRILEEVIASAPGTGA